MVKVANTMLALATLLCTACSSLDLGGLFDAQSPTIDERFAQSAAWNDSHPTRTLRVADDNYKVVFAADTHVGEHSATLAALVDASTDAAALFILGDLTDSGQEYDAFAQQTSSVANLFVTAGNHDLFFGGWSGYAAHFGSSAYTVEIDTDEARDLYILFDTAGGTVGRQQFAWIEQTLKERRKDYRHCIVGSHTNIIKNDISQLTSGNLPLDETYKLLKLFADYRVELSIEGHDHYRTTNHCRGVEYVTLDAACDAVANPSRFVISVGDKLTKEFAAILR